VTGLIALLIEIVLLHDLSYKINTSDSVILSAMNRSNSFIFRSRCEMFVSVCSEGDYSLYFLIEDTRP